MSQKRETQAFVMAAHAADRLTAGLAELLKPRQLSPAAYNVLRILRGAGAGGLACGEIGARMIAREPDITRLLDRLERRGLVARSRESGDRRVVTVRIAEAGLSLIAGLDNAVERLHQRQFAMFAPEELATLIEYLRRVAEGS